MNRLDMLALKLPPSLRSVTMTKTFGPRVDLFLQGQPATEILEIVSGRVKLWRTGEDGAACTLLLLGKGEVLGSVAVAQAAPHLTAATALDQVSTLAWPATLFRAAVRNNAELSQSFLQAVARRAMQLMDRFDDIAGLDVETRLARLLLRLSAKTGSHDDALAVVLSIRQLDLAELALTTVPTVSRVLTRWKEAGIVSPGRGRIVIPHMSKLALRGGIHLD